MFKTIQETQSELAQTKRDNVHVSEDGTIVNMLSVRQIRDFLLQMGVSYDYVIIRVGDVVTSSSNGLEWDVKSYNSSNPISGVIIAMTSQHMERKKFISVDDMAITQEDINSAQDIIGFYVSVALSRTIRGTIYEFLDVPVIGTNPQGEEEEELYTSYTVDKQILDNTDKDEKPALDLMNAQPPTKKEVSNKVTSMLDLIG